MIARSVALTVTAAAGGLLTAMSLSAGTAQADDYSITPLDPGTDVVSETGMPPFYQSVIQQGTFEVERDFTGGGSAAGSISGTLYTDNSFGMSNEDFIVSSGTLGIPDHSVIDIANFGGGFENLYADIPAYEYGAQVVPQEITDTLITPFGDFNIPTTFDASAFFEPASAASSGWATLVADFSALL